MLVFMPARDSTSMVTPTAWRGVAGTVGEEASLTGACPTTWPAAAMG